MLKDADHSYFAGVYIVCGYTDLRFGIDSLAAIIERRFHMNLFVPNTLFLFCGRSSTKIKGLLWEGDGFLLLYKRVESGHFSWPRSSNDLRSLSAGQFQCKQVIIRICPRLLFSDTLFSSNERN